jgi:hypothetical protein
MECVDGGRNRSLPNVGYYLDFCLKRFWKTATNLSEDIRCPERDSNRAPPEYKSEALLLVLNSLKENV